MSKSKPDRWQRTVQKVLDSLGKGKHGPWPEPMIKAFRGEHAAVVRNVKQQIRYEEAAIRANGKNVRWHHYGKLLLEQQLAWLDARGK